MFAGIALEELQQSSNTSTKICDGDVVQCFDNAVDFFLSMLLGSDNKSSSMRIQSPPGLLTKEFNFIGQPLEVALQRSIILRIKQG